MMRITCVAIIILVFIYNPQPALSKPAAPVEAPQDDVFVYMPLVLHRHPINNIFGVTMYAFNSAHGIDQMAAANIGWSRRVVNWSSIEPSEGVRNWDPNFDQELITARQNNIRVILILEVTPAWALKPGFACGAVAPDKFAALGNFAYDLVSRYSAEPYRVEYYELWNEPDAAHILGCWGDPNDTLYYGGAYYGQMFKAVAPRMKLADPQAQLLVGGLLLDCDPTNPPPGKSCIESRFLEGILSVGGGPYFDGVAFHGYDYYTGLGTYINSNWHTAWNTTGPVSLAKANFLKNVLNAKGYYNKYLINTENAILYGPNVQDITCVDYAPQPDIEITKMYYVIQSYTQALSQGWRAHIWYSAFGVRCSGLLETDLTPKRAYYALAYTADRLGKAAFMRDVTQFGGVTGYEFLAGQHRIWVLWSKDGANHNISLPSVPQIVDQIGNDGNAISETPAPTAEISLAPKFIYFSP